MDFIINEVGEKLKVLRNYFGYSQGDIAEYLGITKQAISNWENSKENISSKHINNVAKLFRLTPDELLNSPNKDLINIACQKGLSQVNKQQKSINKVKNLSNTNILNTSKLNTNESNHISTKKKYEITGERNNVFDLNKSKVNEAQAEYAAGESILQRENEMLKKRIAELEEQVNDLKKDKNRMDGQILFLQEELKRR